MTYEILWNPSTQTGIAIRTDEKIHLVFLKKFFHRPFKPDPPCLLYTSDAADERSSVDLGGRRIIKKKKNKKKNKKADEITGQVNSMQDDTTTSTTN